MSHFVPNNCHLREVLLFFFYLKKTAAEAHRELQKVYGDAALSETTCRDWFRRFKDGDFDIDDRSREGRPKTFEDAELEALLDEDPCKTQEELASAFGYPPNHFQAIACVGNDSKARNLGYDLKPRDVERRFFTCEQLLQRQKREGFSSGAFRYSLQVLALDVTKVYCWCRSVIVLSAFKLL